MEDQSLDDERLRTRIGVLGAHASKGKFSYRFGRRALEWQQLTQSGSVGRIEGSLDFTREHGLESSLGRLLGLKRTISRSSRPLYAPATFRFETSAMTIDGCLFRSPRCPRANWAAVSRSSVHESPIRAAAECPR
jgi:hypothetical protein